jgi:hypothetical protein
MAQRLAPLDADQVFALTEGSSVRQPKRANA